MLKHILIKEKQAVAGNYRFNDVLAACTANFYNTFGDETEQIMDSSMILINVLEEHPDRLQVFRYGGKKFYVISDYTYDTPLSEIQELTKMKIPVVTFMLPGDY